MSASGAVRARARDALASVVVGSRHACGLTTSGVAYCWGSNEYGQIGDGTYGGSRNLAVKVPTEFTFTSLTAGTSHTCGVASTGEAYCWGSNDRGQAGPNGTWVNNGQQSVNSSPVPSLIAGGYLWTTVTAGGAHTCGVTTGGAGVLLGVR